MECSEQHAYHTPFLKALCMEENWKRFWDTVVANNIREASSDTPGKLQRDSHTDYDSILKKSLWKFKPSRISERKCGAQNPYLAKELLVFGSSGKKEFSLMVSPLRSAKLQGSPLPNWIHELDTKSRALKVA